MLSMSKDKKSSKSSLKTSSKQQSSSKVQQLPTTRIGKMSYKNHPLIQQKRIRSPQMIKLMIDQLQQQLFTKTKSKNALENSSSSLSRTKRSLIQSQKTQSQMKATFLSTNITWKSPKKSKQNKLQKSCTNKNKQITIRNDSAEKSSAKIKKLPYQSSQDTELIKTTRKLNSSSKKFHKKSRDAKQNFIFFDNDLVAFPHQQIPLIILESNSQVLENSQIFSLRNELKNQIDDKKNSFTTHSKVQSLDSVNTNYQKHVNYVERSFCEDDWSQQQNVQNESFFELNILHKKILQNPKSQPSLTSQYQSQNIKLDLNKMIEINNSVLKIQKWWRHCSFHGKLKKEKQQLQCIKQSLQTIQTKEEQSQKNISQFKKQQTNKKCDQRYQQSQSVSEKQIHTQDFKDHTDILKLRQNAAYIQFSTHQKILKELFVKNKITAEQYQQKLQQVNVNLSSELNEIAKIETILKQSAQKVQNIMTKTKQDIQAVKKIISAQQQQQQNTQNNNNNNQQLKSTYKQFQKQNTQHNNDILSAIFGQQQQSSVQDKVIIVSRSLSSSQGRQCKRLGKNFKSYQTELDQFVNDDVSDDNERQQQQQEDSILSCKDERIFCSPNTHSEESLPSPHEWNQPQSQSSQNVPQSQQILACTKTIQTPCSQNISPSPLTAFPLTANFQQLFKQYQQQQQTKQLIELRISKQLGVVQQNNDHHQLLNMIQKSQKSTNDPQSSITTSIISIHKFLINFFKFYLYYHKDQFLQLMNMPYGQAIQTRLAKNKLQKPQYALQQWTRTSFFTDDDQQIIYGMKNVIDHSVLDEFFDSYYEQTDIQFTEVEKANIQLEKIHNRAVFDAFNHALNFFRPYYNIGGAPYLWCSSQKSLTFFCIGEDNIQEVYEKTQMKILKMSSHLCGVIVDGVGGKKVVMEKQEVNERKQNISEIQSPFKVMENQSSTSQTNHIKKVTTFQQFLQSYTQNFNPIYLLNLQERLKKKQLAEAEQQNLQWFSNTFEQSKVSTLLNLTELIEEIIMLEECSIIKNIHAQETKKQMLDQNISTNEQ